jgi:hypothetical protein
MALRGLRALHALLWRHPLISISNCQEPVLQSRQICVLSLRAGEFQSRDSPTRMQKHFKFTCCSRATDLALRALVKFLLPFLHSLWHIGLPLIRLTNVLVRCEELGTASKGIMRCLVKASLQETSRAQKSSGYTHMSLRITRRLLVSSLPNCQVCHG